MADLRLVGDPGSQTQLQLYNTIIANNLSSSANCLLSGSYGFGYGFNLIEVQFVGAECQATALSSDPQLGPLQINAPGNTPTMAITSASPAFNSGDNNTCLATDQRGEPRPALTTCDLGAFEAQKYTPTLATQASTTQVVIGNSFNDVATLAGGLNPTGTITFNLYPPSNPQCTAAVVQEIVNVNGNGQYSPANPYQAIAVGIYRW